MLFWIKKKLERAIPALYKYKLNTSGVNKSHIENMCTLHVSEKAFYRHSLCGSMTVEASLVLPLVFYVWIACVAWTSIVNVHTTMQHTLGEIAVEAAIASGSNEEIVRNTSGLNAWIRSLCLDDLEKGGIERVYDFDFSKSEILGNDSGILLNVRYRVKLLEGILPIPSLRLSNQVYTRGWTGGESKKEHSDFGMNAGESVYVSEYGHVYHTDRMCSHIHLTIYMVEESQTSNYIPCDKCSGSGTYRGQTFYITESGEHYHTRLGCSGLKRQVDYLPMTEVSTMGYRPCSRCSGGG